MKHIPNFFKYISVILVLMIVVSSCQKQLEKSPLDKFDQSTFWTNQSNLMLALTGLYHGNIVFNKPDYSSSDWWSYSGLLFMEFASDNAYDRRGENSPYQKLSNGTLTSSTAVLGFYWKNSYSRIANCNYFLENVDKSSASDDIKNRFKAEAKFIRACQYFYLSQFYGSVPLVTKTLSPDEANTVTKASKDDVEKFAETEFIAAAQSLPDHKDMPTSEFGRANKQAALAFLGRLYLSEHRWTDAAATYKQIIDLGANIIDPNYASLFDGSNENSKEIIFSLQYLQNLDGSSLMQHCDPAVVGGWHIFCPLGSLVEAYDFSDGTPFSYTDARYDANDIGKDRDPRLKCTVLYNEENFRGLKYICHPDSTTSPDQLGAGKQTTQTGYGLKKYIDENYSSNLQSSGGDLPIIRYAEVLLSYLEAKIEAGDAIDQGLLDQTINQVRGRASVNLPPITETNPALLLPIVRHERRVELACEGTRYWDLLRWKTAETVLNDNFYGAPFPGAKKIKKLNNQNDPYSRWFVTTRKFRADKDYQWPIPQSEVNINPNLQ
jgi:hypothetical protein